MALDSIQSILHLPLYRTEKLRNVDGILLQKLRGKSHKIDMYCPFCEMNSTFSIYHSHINSNPDNYLANVIFSLSYTCARENDHKLMYWFSINNMEIIKIGQTPSLADLSFPELNEYKKILGRDRLAELKKAVGLVSHGIGAGSFVYLRRIFESILWDHYQRMKREGQEPENFASKRMDEKIESLKSTLPDFLVNNKQMYGIMSKGVHELSEQECLEHFPVIYRSTLMILQKDEEQRRQTEQEALLAAELQKIASSMSSTN